MMRPSLDQFFMAFAEVAALMSTCLHRQEGVVAVQGKRIIDTGHNGVPSGLPHYDQGGGSVASLCVRLWSKYDGK